MPPGAETLLFVCTGNVCRSPYLERTARRSIDGSGSTLRVASAGTAALVGHAIADRMAEVLRHRGVDADGFRAQQATPRVVAGATLIITATREHARWVARLDPEAVTRTFTLVQAARLLAVSEPDEPAAGPQRSLGPLLSRLHLARGAGGRGTSSDDIEDPWGRSRWTYRRTAARMDAALAPLLQQLVH